MLNILGTKTIIGNDELINGIKTAHKTLIELETINIIVDGRETTMAKVEKIINDYDEMQEEHIEWDEPTETEKEYCKNNKLNVVEKTRTVEELRTLYLNRYNK